MIMTRLAMVPGHEIGRISFSKFRISFSTSRKVYHAARNAADMLTELQDALACVRVCVCVSK